MQSSKQSIGDLIARGQQALQAGDNAQAETLFSYALRIDSRNVDALHLLGISAHRLGKLDAAIELITKAIKIAPSAPSLHLNLGNALKAQGNQAEAIKCYRQAVRLDSGYFRAHNNLGVELSALGHLTEAAKHLSEALRLFPAYPEAHLNLGKVKHQQGALDEAVKHYQEALRLKPDYAEAYTNLGVALNNQANVAAAIEALRLACRLEPKSPEANWNLALAQLNQGNLREGWENYDWRLGKAPDALKANFRPPLWDGGELAAKTLLIRAEQGVGDEIMFAGLFLDAIAAAGHCVIECDSRLVPLFARSFPQSEVIPKTKPLHPRATQPDIDLQSPAGSLARFFRPTVESFPLHQGYLTPDPLRLAFWRQRIAALGEGLKVGICWRSMLMSAERSIHYTNLSQWAPILRVPGITFVNLQYDNCQAELEQSEKSFGVKIHTWDDIDLMNDLDGAAALTAALDLVITSPTAVASMAGALGVPTWELYPANTWITLGTNHLPWFPHLRLFTRAWNEKWETVIQNLTDALVMFSNKNSRLAMPAKESPPAGTPPKARIDALISSAMEYHRAGNIPRAEVLYRQALELDPANLDALHLQGLALQHAGKIEAAVESVSKAIALNNNIPNFHLTLGIMLTNQGKLDLAIEHYREAIRLKPDYVEAHINLGVAFKEQGLLDKAIECYCTALGFNPNNFTAENNLGVILLSQGKGKEAAEHLRAALHIEPNDAKAHCNLAQALLLSGNLTEGWKEHEWRMIRHGIQYKLNLPIWNGESPAGKTILLWGEQGVGDEILFASMFPEIIDAAGHCIIECDARLVPLFARSFPTAETIPKRASLLHPRATEPDIDFQITAGSLARWLRPSLDRFPARDSFLIPDPERLSFWKQRLAGLGDGVKVGICWRSKLVTSDRALHYTELSQWGPVFSVPGITFVNLQYDNCQAELEQSEKSFGVKIHTWDDIDLMNDLDDAAALTAALDLVITAPTAVASMAGALGVPVWQMSPVNWTALGSNRFPWHPSMRMFFRPWNLPWEPTIQSVALELQRDRPLTE
jgi:tetratricopeptide (TPR) repeat protein